MDSLYWQSVKIGLITRSNLEKRKLTVIIVTATVLFLAFILSLNLLLSIFPKNKVTENPNVLGVSDVGQPIINATEPSTLLPTPTPIPTGIPAITVFEATLSAKTTIESTVGLYLADVLVDALKLPLVAGKPYPIKKILYDTVDVASAAALRQNPYNSHFYIVLASPYPVKEYSQSAYINIKTKPISPDLLPYFLDTTYCQTDNDCLVRESLCQNNAFNRFEVYLDKYSCRPLVPKISEPLTYSETYGCYLTTTTSPPVCNQNHCQLNEVQQCL